MNNHLAERIAVARGLKKADVVLKGGRVVNVFSGEISETDVAISHGRIAGLGSYQGKTAIDVSRRLLLPGFIDSHVHIESSMLTPAEYTRVALPHGTTALIADPHEIANVLGAKGIRSMIDATNNLPLDFYFMLPSCVPASALETSGAKLEAGRLLPFVSHERVIGLAEVMDYRGVLSGSRDILKKLSAFGNTVMDGHAPALGGKDLAAYIGAGISSDHECVSAAEALEKIRLGMTVIIRESSAAKNLKALLPAVTRANSEWFCFGTDDLQPADLKNGSINRMIKTAIELGLDPVIAIKIATINAARHFGLRDRGAIAPGFIADVVVIDSFKNFRVEKVFKTGKLVAGNGQVTSPVRGNRRLSPKHTVKTGAISVQDIKLGFRTGHARVIELVPDQIETREKIMPVIVDNGMVANDRDRDIAKMIVVERHKASGRIGIGLVRGFGLKSGAFASTVAHDSHNIVAVGMYDEDILAAVRTVKKMKGGMVVVYKKRVLASLPLPVAGLMSEKPAEFVVRRQIALGKAVKKLGVKIKSPFAALSFLALPVIPDLKLTDRGLVDVKQSKYVDLFI